MRAARILLPLLVALTAAACARQQASYVVDPATGQPVPVVQRYGQSYTPNSQQASAAPQAYAQPSNGHGLFNSHTGLFAQRRSAYPQTYAQPSHPQPYGAQRAYAEAGRGYVQRRPYGPRSYVMQYHPPHRAARAANAYASTSYDSYGNTPARQAYTLGPGDKLRVVVFGQQGITGSYMVDAGGNISLPLIGSVSAQGHTTQQLASMIADRLKQGYVREPHVTVDIQSYRPFFILGEVTTPGQYPYVPNMTVVNAVAIAGGFAPRADKHEVQLTRNSGGHHYRGDVPLNYPLRPGDTLMVKERWF